MTEPRGNNGARPELRSLTGLRGVAATLVMLDHYAAVDFTAPFPLRMLPHMYLAVDMFMLLSGFILAMTYEDRLRGLGFAAGCRLFLGRRIARLYPLYAVATITCFVLCRAGLLTFLDPDTSAAALAANLLAVQTWFWPGNSLDGPGWSISAEWFANLLFPALLPVILGRSFPLAAAAAGTGFALLVASAVLFGQLFDVPTPGAANTITGAGALGRCLGEFVVGMYVWRLRARHAAAVCSLAGTAVQLLLLLALVALFEAPWLDTLSVALCAALLLGLSFERSVPAALLQSRPLLALGRISYSVYLVHITLLPLRDALYRGLEPRPWAWPAAVAVTAAAALALAGICRRWIEPIARRPRPGWVDRAPHRA